MLIFNMSDYTSSDTYELPDSFFDVTTNDCAAMQKDLHRQVQNLTDVPMMTAYHRQATQLTKYSHYETVCLLYFLRLGEQYFLDGVTDIPMHKYHITRY